jgi:hypothetical protein
VGEMIKKGIVFLLLLLSAVLLFNYFYSWKLSNHFKFANYDGLSISYIDSNSHRKVYKIKDKRTINQIYEYIYKLHGRKYFPWHGRSTSFDENYFLDFSIQGKVPDMCSDIYRLGKGWNIYFFNNDRYKLDKHTFNIDYFKSLLN